MQNFQEALEALGNKDRTRLLNNTYLERISADEIGVLYHRTYIVRFKRNGSVTLHTGGWQTTSTKERMNAYSPARIHQERGQWFLSTGEPFHDGIEVNEPNSLIEDEVSLFL